MTAERDLRENTRALKDTVKALGETARLNTELLKVAKTIAESMGVGSTDRQVTTRYSAMGVTVAEVKQNIEKIGLVSVCRLCFVGKCVAGEIQNDNCACCNKSHRKS